MGTSLDNMSSSKVLEPRLLTVVQADMPEEMQQEAVDIASEELDKGSKTNPSLKDIAMVIKRKFDDKYNPSWHCIVGRTFGSYVTFEHLFHFELGLEGTAPISVFLYKVRPRVNTGAGRNTRRST